MSNEKAVEKAFDYLESQSSDGFYRCQLSHNRKMTNPKYSPNEVASSILILQTAFLHKSHSLQKNKIIRYIKNQLQEDNSISFFESKSLLPPDADTTSFTLSTLLNLKELNTIQTEKIARKIINNKDNGKIQIYFNPKKYNRKNRFDKVGLSNIAYFLFVQGLESEAENQLGKIKDYFTSGNYLKGSRYYFSPESAIYFASRLTEFPRGKRNFNLF